MEDITMSRAARNKTGAIYGVVLGLIYIILGTITDLTFSGNLLLFTVLNVVNFALYVVILAIMAKMIRKNNGGFIEYKELFGAIFVILLVSSSMSYIYNWVFMNFIDPHFTEKIIEATRLQIEHLNLPDDKTEEALKSLDNDSTTATKFDVLAWAGRIVRECVFGLIVAAIMKKSKPVFE